jgi:hypothetical protein
MAEWPELLLHGVFGLGPGWMLTDSIFIEVALVQASQPEHLRMAALLGLSASLGSSFVVPLHALVQWRFRIPLHWWVGGSILAQLLVTALLIFAWPFHAGGVSLVLHLGVFTACVVGNMQQLAVLPWLANDPSREQVSDNRVVWGSWVMGVRVAWDEHVVPCYRARPRFVQKARHTFYARCTLARQVSKDRVVSATMGGGNFGACLAAALGAWQGSPDEPRCSVSVFFALQLVGVLLSAVAFALILRRRLRTARISGPVVGDAGREPDDAVLSHEPDKVEQSPSDPVDRGSRHGALAKLRAAVVAKLPVFWKHRWVVRICAVNSLLQIVTWVVVRAMLPFAARSAAGDPEGSTQDQIDGAYFLGMAVQASLVCVLLGAAASIFVPNRALRLDLTLACSAIPAGIICAMAAGWRPFVYSDAGGALVVGCASMCRFTDGLASPLLYRAVGDPFPEAEKPAVVQWTGTSAIVSTVIAAWLLVLFMGGLHLE